MSPDGNRIEALMSVVAAESSRGNDLRHRNLSHTESIFFVRINRQLFTSCALHVCRLSDVGAIRIIKINLHKCCAIDKNSLIYSRARCEGAFACVFCFIQWNRNSTSANVRRQTNQTNRLNRRQRGDVNAYAHIRQKHNRFATCSMCLRWMWFTFERTSELMEIDDGNR